jgi:hypothetical protein
MHGRIDIAVAGRIPFQIRIALPDGGRQIIPQNFWEFILDK